MYREWEREGPQHAFCPPTCRWRKNWFTPTGLYIPNGFNDIASERDRDRYRDRTNKRFIKRHLHH